MNDRKCTFESTHSDHSHILLLIMFALLFNYEIHLTAFSAMLDTHTLCAIQVHSDNL